MRIESHCGSTDTSKGRVRTLTILIAVLLLVSVGAAQIRTTVDLVVVPVSVRDGKGRLVAGLTQKDFTILEDKIPQVITNFSDDPQPLSAAIVIDTGMGGLAMRRLVPLFISITSGFSEFDEMSTFRYDQLVFQLSDFTSDDEKIEKSLAIVKTIAAKQPAKVAQGDPAPTAPKILQTVLGMLNLGGNGALIDNPQPGMAGPVRKPTTETVPTVGTKRVDPGRALFDAIYDAAKALEQRPPGRRRSGHFLKPRKAIGNIAATAEQPAGAVQRLQQAGLSDRFQQVIDGAQAEGADGVLRMRRGENGAWGLIHGVEHIETGAVAIHAWVGDDHPRPARCKQSCIGAS